MAVSVPWTVDGGMAVSVPWTVDDGRPEREWMPPSERPSAPAQSEPGKGPRTAPSGSPYKKHHGCIGADLNGGIGAASRRRRGGETAVRTSEKTRRQDTLSARIIKGGGFLFGSGSSGSSRSG